MGEQYHLSGIRVYPSRRHTSSTGITLRHGIDHIAQGSREPKQSTLHFLRLDLGQLSPGQSLHNSYAMGLEAEIRWVLASKASYQHSSGQRLHSFSCIPDAAFRAFIEILGPIVDATVWLSRVELSINAPSPRDDHCWGVIGRKGIPARGALIAFLPPWPGKLMQRPHHYGSDHRPCGSDGGGFEVNFATVNETQG